MKALFFNQDLFMGTEEIGYVHKEHRIPIRTIKELEVHVGLKVPMQSSIPCFLYELVDMGRSHAIYELKGIEE